eukprot:scaffold18.g1897.t1
METDKKRRNSRILVPHVDRHYVAVVLRGQKRPEGYYYFVHYEGWGPKWDEWVAEKDVKRIDRELLAREEAELGPPGAAGGRGGRKRKGPEAGGGGGGAAAGAPDVPPGTLRLAMPPLLKKAVIDDFEQARGAGANRCSVFWNMSGAGEAENGGWDRIRSADPTASCQPWLALRRHAGA